MLIPDPAFCTGHALKMFWHMQGARVAGESGGHQVHGDDRICACAECGPPHGPGLLGRTAAATAPAGASYALLKI